MSEVRSEQPLGGGTADESVPTRLGIAALARDAGIYGGTRVLLKSLGFLLVPLYAHYLTTSQFGVFGLILAIVALVDVLLTANMDGVFMRFFFDRAEERWRRQIISLYLAIETLYPAVVVGLMIAFSGTVSDGVFGTAAYTGLLVIALVDLYLTNVIDLALILCRVRRKPLTFAFYSLTRGLVQVGFTVVLVVAFHLGVKGILIASLVSAGVAFAITFREYARDLTRHLDWKVGREMISFAWPGLIGGLAFYAINLADRFFVLHFHGTSDNGLYEAAFRYSQVVLVGVFAFRLGWPQWHYSWFRTGRHEQMVARGANYYFFGAGFLAVFVSLWILPLFHVLMPERYWPATEAVPPLALGAVATGAYTLFAVGLNVTKRMRLLPPLALVGAAIAIGLNFLLIPSYSYVGAAWATAAAFWALAFIVFFVSNRIYPVPWQWRRLALVLAATLGLALSALAVDAWMPIAVSLPVRLALTLAYPVLLVGLGFFPRDDLEKVRRLILRRDPAAPA